MPLTKRQHKEHLAYKDLLKIVKAAVRLGVRKIRITGGEPLAREGIVGFIETLSAIDGLEDISLTTNGILLEKLAKPLYHAGLSRINVSLDSLRADRYRDITRGGSLSQVLTGIEKAEQAGLNPIKLNNVPVRGVNEDEIETFARLTLHTSFHVRFIEFMPIGSDLWSPMKYVPLHEIRETVEKVAPLTPVKLRRNGPARYYKFPNASGVIGFISALTHHFCDDCNRLRITCDGKIRPCLFSDTEIDLKPALTYQNPDLEIENLLKLAVQIKPEGHLLSEQTYSFPARPMSEIGG
jgi:cyclic pyranopterin phosphate synthase